MRPRASLFARTQHLAASAKIFPPRRRCLIGPPFFRSAQEGSLRIYFLFFCFFLFCPLFRRFYPTSARCNPATSTSSLLHSFSLDILPNLQGPLPTPLTLYYRSYLSSSKVAAPTETLSSMQPPLRAVHPLFLLTPIRIKCPPHPQSYQSNLLSPFCFQQCKIIY